MDAYRLEGWHDFFLATAGAAAALTGLLFVAISLHMRYAAVDPYFRNLARGSLLGLVSVLVASFIFLVNQPATWAGTEFAFFAALSFAGEGWYDVISYRRLTGGQARATLIRSCVGAVLALTALVGGVTMAFQTSPGLYAIAVTLMALTAWNLLNAWILLVGVTDEEIAHQNPN